MNILVLNCGSSSIKYKLYNMDSESVLAQGGAERIGLDEAFVKVTLKDGSKKKIMHDMPDHKEGVKFVFDLLLDKEIGSIKSLDDIDAVGHRVVQGGDLFEKSCLITKEVEAGIEGLIDLAPVHNLGHLRGIRAVNALMPKTPQVAVFDNAFHSTMPQYAYMYAIPYEYYEKYHVRRYGFHGTSHRYVSQRVCDMLGVDIKKQRIITCHIGNGASVAAIKGGKVIDTSMGLTPLEGLMMGSRSGDIDASVVDHLIENLGYDMKTVFKMLNKESGLLGVSGVSGDMRDIIDAKDAGNQRAELAFNMFRKRVADYIGSYFVELGHVDAISFTAGIGENSFIAREAIIDLIKEALSIVLDDKANVEGHGERLISAPESKIKVFVVPTDEELVIARDTKELLNL